eukprot:CAMPEP_0171792278 /NCGR_PEP_ID=MMETSP0991-20121206/66854_1 /TAXON_ID=483369 /ORGANISM="non described non described, Strain CCMP2098" /LENGTH=81 /DNA_ID=CAMNT_0012402297 /DNA_START=169 /DNA_END=415 /DNA_ORIENTATION=-
MEVEKRKAAPKQQAAALKIEKPARPAAPHTSTSTAPKYGPKCGPKPHPELRPQTAAKTAHPSTDHAPLPLASCAEASLNFT